MGGLHVAPWSISRVIRNQQDVSKNKKLVCIAIFVVDDPRLSQYCQYVIYGSAYCYAVHPVVSLTLVKVYLMDTVEYYPNNIQHFLAYAPLTPS